MKFELEFPDSCYDEDKKHYDMFAEALQKMLNRMAMSHNKYQKGLPMDFVVQSIDEMTSARQRMCMYDGEGPWKPYAKEVNTGNTENLLDAANMLVIESILPKHPKAHFKSQASHESPGLEYIP